MMRTVWKFPIPVREGQSSIISQLPADAQVVLVAIDPASGHPALWIDQRTDQPRKRRCFIIVGTGHEVDLSWLHVGSVIDGAFVWHVYEVRS